MNKRPKDCFGFFSKAGLSQPARKLRRARSQLRHPIQELLNRLADLPNIPVSQKRRNEGNDFLVLRVLIPMDELHRV
jgi:hypothetical protein